MSYTTIRATLVPDLAAISLAGFGIEKIFQRDTTGTEGTITISGSTSGQATAIEARVLNSGDDSTVVDWTTIDASPAINAFSGDIVVPTGGPYYCEVRDTVATSVGDSGTANFYVGIVVIAYGQSNMTNLFNTSGASGADAAAARTLHFDSAGNVWGSVPDQKGVRTFLNTINAYTGLPVGTIEGTTIGAPSSYFTEGLDGYAKLLTRLRASGGKAEAIIVHQGEGDALGVATKDEFKTHWASIHDSIAAEVGRTKAQIPMFFASLLRYPQAIGTDARWWDIQAGIRELCDENANIHFSHSSIPLGVGSDGHRDIDGIVDGALLYAESVAYLLGEASANPAWFITGVAKASTTTTTVTVAHSMGTDFTPTSGITGFEVSDDNSTWITATGARTDTTTITLTHDALPNGSSDDRYVRYQYGRNPDASGAVLDNGTLTAPLSLSAGQTLVDAGV